MLSRRNFLKSILSTSAALFLKPGMISAAQTIDDFLSDNIPLQRKIPKTGENICAIGLGTARKFKQISSPEDYQRHKLILQQFFRYGGQLIDTAPMYRNEENLGILLNDIQTDDELFMATKVRISGVENGKNQMKDSFVKLNSGQIDLMQVHSLVDWKTQLNTLQEQKKKGVYRYIGITHSFHWAFDDLERVLKTQNIDFIQLNFSIAQPQAQDRLLPLAQEKGVAVIINKPYLVGKLFDWVANQPVPPWAKEFGCTNWAGFFLKYIISHPAVTCAIPATGNPDHLVENMQAAIGPLPDNKQRKQMRKHFLTL